MAEHENHHVHHHHHVHERPSSARLDPRRIVVFTKPDCPDCFNAKRYFTNLGLSFETRDISDPKAVEELLEVLGPGNYATPIIFLGENVFIGFQANREHIAHIASRMKGG